MFQFALEQGIVEVQVEDTSVGTIVPVAPANRQTQYSVPYLLTLFIQPPTILPISTTRPDHCSYFFGGKNLSYMTIGHMPLTFPLLHLIPVV